MERGGRGGGAPTRCMVSLAMPIGAIENLEDVMDEEVVAKIEARGISPRDAVGDSRRSGCAPAELFTLDLPEENKRICIWAQ